ncbi:MAG: YARHG domain-containing protein [Bacteroidetes bacterium]|nr:YARHG domain-containing protein [Bacteroidota bacterium]
MLRSLFFCLFSFTIIALTQAQMMGFDEIDPAKISPWKASDITDFQGIYHFGESELESNLVLVVERDLISAQIRSGHFQEINGQTVFLMEYKNLTHVKITGNQFYSDEYQGSFVVFEPNDEPLWALKINNPWSDIPQTGQYELGPKLEIFVEYFPGKFPFASTRLLKDSEMGQYSKADLGIMRNEIFARYGYIFQSGGKMEAYFKQQDWYFSASKDVNDALTEIEKQNIQMIRKWEGK